MIVNIGLILKTSDQNDSLMQMASLLKMNGWFHLVLEDDCVLEKFWQEICCFLFFQVSCRSSRLELQKKIPVPQLMHFQGSQQHLHLSGFKWQNASCTLAIMNAMYVLEKCQDNCKWEGCGRKWSLDCLKLFWYFLEQIGPVGGPKVLKKGSCRFTSCSDVNVVNMKWVWLFLPFLIYIHTYIHFTKLSVWWNSLLSIDLR